MFPDPLDGLVVDLEFPWSMLHSFGPSPSEDLAIREEESPLSLFDAIAVLPLISVAIRPREDAIP